MSTWKACLQLSTWTLTSSIILSAQPLILIHDMAYTGGSLEARGPVTAFLSFICSAAAWRIVGCCSDPRLLYDTHDLVIFRQSTVRQSFAFTGIHGMVPVLVLMCAFLHHFNTISILKSEWGWVSAWASVHVRRSLMELCLYRLVSRSLP